MMFNHLRWSLNGNKVREQYKNYFKVSTYFIFCKTESLLYCLILLTQTSSLNKVLMLLKINLKTHTKDVFIKVNNPV